MIFRGRPRRRTQCADGPAETVPAARRSDRAGTRRRGAAGRRGRSRCRRHRPARPGTGTTRQAAGARSLRLPEPTADMRATVEARTAVAGGALWAAAGRCDGCWRPADHPTLDAGAVRRTCATATLATLPSRFLTGVRRAAAATLRRSRGGTSPGFESCRVIGASTPISGNTGAKCKNSRWRIPPSCAIGYLRLDYAVGDAGRELATLVVTPVNWRVAGTRGTPGPASSIQRPEVRLPSDIRAESIRPGTRIPNFNSYSYRYGCADRIISAAA